MFTPSINFYFSAKQMTQKVTNYIMISKKSGKLYEWRLVEGDALVTNVRLNNTDIVLARLTSMLKMIDLENERYDSILVNIPGFPRVQLDGDDHIPVDNIVKMVAEVLEDWPDSSYEDEDYSDMPPLIPISQDEDDNEIPPLIPITKLNQSVWG